MEVFQEILDSIIKSYNVNKVYLYNTKFNITGDKIKQFNIAVILNSGDAKEVEKEIYLNTDIKIPFVCLVYNKEVWADLLEKEFSFASTIIKKGKLIYG